MQKKQGLWILFWRVFWDVVVLASSWLLAYLIRFEWFYDSAQSHQEWTFIRLLLPLLGISLLTLQFQGAYKTSGPLGRPPEVLAVIRGNLQAVFAFVLILYFFAPERISRITILIYFILSSLFLLLERAIFTRYLQRELKKGRGIFRPLLVGNGPQLEEFLKKVSPVEESGIQCLGRVDGKNGGPLHLDMTLEEAKTKLRPDALIIGHLGSEGHKTSELIREHYNDTLPIHVLPDLSYSFIGHEVSDFEGLPVLTLNHPRFSTQDRILKRAFDFFASAVGLVLISPFLLLLALLVKLSSKGPIFYGQERVGLDGRPFTMWKFRSMAIDAEKESGAVWAVENDPRRTKLGTFLRASSLDELPQLWNVLKGDMGLVGPRPERPVFVEKFRHEIPHYMLRHKMKAGITGLAQVRGWRGNTSLEKRIECDLYYIKNWSLWLDLKILFLTLWKGLIHKNAY